MNQHEKINYLELPSNNLGTTKIFFQQVFNWSFQDYGEEYTAFFDGTINGGFFKSELSSSTQKGSALIVFYSHNLIDTQQKIEQAGGKIIEPTFSFPGGRRFHFSDPSNNEYAVWSDK